MFDSASQESPTPPAAEVDAMLAQMAVEGRTALEAVGRGSSPSVRPPKIRYTHEAMADLILENPWISQNQLAAHFGYSPAWISTVITSDAFQALLASRREELVDPELRITLQERFKALCTQSLRVLQEKISKPADLVNDQLVLRTAELSAKSLGLGVAAPSPAAPDPAKYLPELAERLLRLGGRMPTGQAEDAVIVGE